jgi:dTMP kinase
LSLGDRVSRYGLFIVMEGGDGAGKTTHATRLAELLRADGHEVVMTREPGATDVGRQIRSLLLAGGPMGLAAAAPRAEALLYAADRAHHVAAVIRPALERGAVVICERYVDSALAYLEAGRTLPVDEVAWLSGWATGGLKPDLVVLLDIDPTAGLRRANHRTGDPASDPDTLHFAERVRYAFLDRSAKDPNRYLVLDASRPTESVATFIVDRVERILPAVPRDAPASPLDVGPPDAGPPDAGPPGAADPPPELGATTAPLIAGPLTTVDPPSDDGPDGDAPPPGWFSAAERRP